MQHRTLLILLAVFYAQFSMGQEIFDGLYISPEFLVGKTLPANTDFPETNLQTAFFLNIGTTNYSSSQDWAVRLNYPKTGLSVGVIDFGNSEKLGRAYTVMPFAEFALLRKKSKRFNLNIGVGGSYMDTQFDEVDNPFNRAITTKVNWSFKMFLYYDLLQKKSVNWRFGLGYIHHSNGHTRLPNQGLNSFLGSVSATIKTSKNTIAIPEKPKLNSKSETYFSSRVGLGFHVLSDSVNTKKPVYSMAFSAGKVINKTFKFGGGIYMRYYQHFYDYIKEERRLINDQFPQFKENAFGYSTNFGLFGTAELLLGHVGFEVDIGLNIYKPFYKLEWQITQGFAFPNGYKLGELDSYYELKRTITSRMGLKYYLFNNNNSPKQNLFLSAHINANLGQADFTELSLGYICRLGE